MLRDLALLFAERQTKYAMESRKEQKVMVGRNPSMKLGKGHRTQLLKRTPGGAA